MNAPGRWIVPALVLVLAAAGCSKSPDEEDAGEDMSALNTNIEITKVDVPARYSAALPNSDAGMQRWIEGDEKLPPFVHVKDQVLNGDVKWFEKLSAAAKGVRAAEAEAWATRWDDALQYESSTPEFCRPAKAVMAAPASTLRRALVGIYANHCATHADIGLMVRDDTPDSAVLKYYGSIFGGSSDEDKHPYHARLAAAARSAISSDSYQATSAAVLLAEHPDSRARAELRKIQAQIKDPQRAADVALAFFSSRDPADKALAKAACKHHPEHPLCGKAAALVDMLDTLDVEEEEPGPKVTKPSPAAVKAMIDKLAAAGFSKVSSIDPAEAETDSADQLLAYAGHAYWFDVETGMYPNNHDSLMRSLAALVSPELDDVIIEETAPGIDDETGPYTLTVYSGGKRLRAEARNLGDWYDVEAVINLLNAVAKERGSKSRFVALASEDQTMAVLGAPAGAIARAIQGGLIEVGGDKN